MTMRMALELQFKGKRPIEWLRIKFQPDTGKHQDVERLASKTVGLQKKLENFVHWPIQNKNNARIRKVNEYKLMYL